MTHPPVKEGDGISLFCLTLSGISAALSLVNITRAGPLLGGLIIIIFINNNQLESETYTKHRSVELEILDKLVVIPIIFQVPVAKLNCFS